MPLQGTFDVLSFSEILRLLSRQSLTGRLHLRSRSYGAKLFFEDGALVGADQSEHQAAAAAGDVRNRVEEICFELLEADRGSFEFQPGKPTALPGAIRLKVETVLTRARKRLEEWRVLSERVPSLEVQPRLVADLDASEVTLDKQRWKMLTVVDGRRNLRTIGRTLNLSDFDVCRILVDLLDAGVVELDGVAAVLAASGRDLVPTIPLPEGLSDSLVNQGPSGGEDIEDVTVTRVESGPPAAGPRRLAGRPPRPPGNLAPPSEPQAQAGPDRPPRQPETGTARTSRGARGRGRRQRRHPPRRIRRFPPSGGPGAARREAGRRRRRASRVRRPGRPGRPEATTVTSRPSGPGGWCASGPGSRGPTTRRPRSPAS